METAAPRTYPASLVVAGQACLVVGAGRVAARKADELGACGAALTIVAPAISSECRAVAARHRARVLRRAYRPGEASGYRLVLSATGVRDVDRLVADDAARAGAWMNCASDAALCTFFVPAVHRDGRVSIAVSTGGASPTLAAWLRTRIATALGAGLGTLAELMAGARRRGQEDRPGWRELLGGPLPRLVREGRLDEARRLLERPGG